MLKNKKVFFRTFSLTACNNRLANMDNFVTLSRGFWATNIIILVQGPQEGSGYGIQNKC